MSATTISPSFTEKAIDLTITLGTGNDGAGAGSAVTLTGLRTIATIVPSVAPNFGTAHVVVYGVTLDIMNSITNVLDPGYFARNNTILIAAGDVGNTQTVFQGVLRDAFMNFDAAPETCMELYAFSSIFTYNQKPSKEVGFEGAVDVADMIQGFITDAEAPFTLNNQLKDPIKISNHVSNQSMWGKISDAADAANINYSFDDRLQTVNIWNRGDVLPADVPLVSPATGMVGYPLKIDGVKVRIKTLFNNAITFGGNVQVSGSVISIANGLWTAYSIEHQLSAYLPGGPWFTIFEGNVPIDSGGSDVFSGEVTDEEE